MDLVSERKGITGWLDGGSIVRDGLSREIMTTRLYSPASAGTIGKWVHNDTKRFMMEHHMIDSYRDDNTMASGNNIYVDYRNLTIRNQSLILLQRVLLYSEVCHSSCFQYEESSTGSSSSLHVHQWSQDISISKWQVSVYPCSSK